MIFDKKSLVSFPSALSRVLEGKVFHSAAESSVYFGSKQTRSLKEKRRQITVGY
jgi:hypothetical protein